MQLVEFALHIIRNTHDFEKALGEWNSKCNTEKTWNNLKTHFTNAQDKLKAIRGPTMAQAGFHQINMLTNNIRDEFAHTRTKLANLIATLNTDNHPASTHMAPPNLPDPTPSSFYSPPATESLANARETNTQLEMLKLLRSMQQELSKMNSPAPPPRASNRSTRNPKKTPNNPPFSRKVTNLYCWTHGGCAHESSKCNSKAPGHRNEATFENKLGGSKGFCP